MERRIISVDRIAGIMVTVVLFVVGLFFILLGVTLLPVIGVFVGVAIMAISVPFSALDATKECKIITFAQTETFCPWPPVSTTEEIGLTVE